MGRGGRWLRERERERERKRKQQKNANIFLFLFLFELVLYNTETNTNTNANSEERFTLDSIQRGRGGQGGNCCRCCCFFDLFGRRKRVEEKLLLSFISRCRRSSGSPFVRVHLAPQQRPAARQREGPYGG